LKPSNVLVTSAGCRLMNFGLSSSATALGEDAAVYGAPEVLEGMPDTSQSDIYSAGVVFYEVLAGRREEARDGRVPKALREVRPDISRDVADAVMACRERSPDWRPKDLTYLLEVVRRERGSASTSVPRSQAPKAAASRPQAAASKSRPATGPTFATRRPARSPLPILIGISVVVVGGAVGWYLSRSSPSGTPAQPAPTTTTQPSRSVAVAPESASPTPAPLPSARAGAEALRSPVPSPAATAAPVAPTPAPSPVEARGQSPRPPVTTLPLQTPPPAAPPTTTLPPPSTLARAQDVPPAEQAASALAILTAVSPPLVKRGGRTLVDVRGTGLRASLQPSVTKGKGSADGIRVINQRFVNATLMQIFFEVDAAAATGTYTIILADATGASNAVRLEIK
jgi:eukaryotic-like serine/threonine-protein kinase